MHPGNMSGGSELGSLRTVKVAQICRQTRRIATVAAIPQCIEFFAEMV